MSKGTIILNDPMRDDDSRIKKMNAKCVAGDGENLFYIKDVTGQTPDWNQKAKAMVVVDQFKMKYALQNTLRHKLLTKKVKAFIDNEPTPAALKEGAVLVAKLYPHERNPPLLFLEMTKDYAKTSLAALGDAPTAAGGAGGSN